MSTIASTPSKPKATIAAPWQGTLKSKGNVMKPLFDTWQFWALLSAAFAALTAIFAKIGVDQVNSDFATFVRTLVILCVIGAILVGTGQWQPVSSVPARTYLFLLFSGVATGGSWLCYFRALKLGDASQVAPIDKLSVVLVAIFAFLFLGERPSGTNWLGILLIGAGAILVAKR
jgi:transporter family protein